MLTPLFLNAEPCHLKLLVLHDRWQDILAQRFLVLGGVLAQYHLLFELQDIFPDRFIVEQGNDAFLHLGEETVVGLSDGKHPSDKCALPHQFVFGRHIGLDQRNDFLRVGCGERCQSDGRHHSLGIYNIYRRRNQQVGGPCASSSVH